MCPACIALEGWRVDPKPLRDEVSPASNPTRPPALLRLAYSSSSSVAVIAARACLALPCTGSSNIHLKPTDPSLVRRGVFCAKDEQRSEMRCDAAVSESACSSRRRCVVAVPLVCGMPLRDPTTHAKPRERTSGVVDEFRDLHSGAYASRMCSLHFRVFHGRLSAREAQSRP